MASLRRDLWLNNNAERVWDAVRDFQAVHTRVAPGFVADSKPDGDARIVTFASGSVFREVLVACDDEQRRLVYAIPEGLGPTYSASVQVFEDGAERCHVVWIVDFLPNEIESRLSEQMDIAAEAMQRTLERQ